MLFYSFIFNGYVKGGESVKEEFKTEKEVITGKEDTNQMFIAKESVRKELKRGVPSSDKDSESVGDMSDTIDEQKEIVKKTVEDTEQDNELKEKPNEERKDGTSKKSVERKEESVKRKEKLGEERKEKPNEGRKKEPNEGRKEESTEETINLSSKKEAQSIPSDNSLLVDNEVKDVSTPKTLSDIPDSLQEKNELQENPTSFSNRISEKASMLRKRIVDLSSETINNLKERKDLSQQISVSKNYLTEFIKGAFNKVCGLFNWVYGSVRNLFN